MHSGNHPQKPRTRARRSTLPSTNRLKVGTTASLNKTHISQGVQEYDGSTRADISDTGDSASNHGELREPFQKLSGLQGRLH